MADTAFVLIVEDEAAHVQTEEQQRAARPDLLQARPDLAQIGPLQDDRQQDRSDQEQ